MEPDKLFRILEGVQTHIRVFDTKAQILIGVNGVLIGFLGLQAMNIAPLIGKLALFPGAALGLLYLLTLLSSVFSLWWAFQTVRPRLELKQPDSKLFYSHIAWLYEKDYEQAAKDYSEMQEAELCTDIGNQILTNSHICVAKTNCLNRASKWIVAAFAFWVGTVVFLFMATTTKG